MTGIAVVGTDHGHVVELTQRLVAAGAEVRAIVATENAIGPWLANQYRDARADDPFASDIDIVVTAAIPDERAEIAIAAMQSGIEVVADKPGVVTPEQLAEVENVQHETGCRYLVAFGERIGSAAMMHAWQRVQDGAIGEVIHTVGLGPHRLNLKHRPAWFSDPDRYGGILVDIGTHQVDQFLAFTGATDAEVVAATVRGHPEQPGVQVLGELLLAAPGATGYARVDYFTPNGLGAWGDVRFTVVGTDGYLEVRVLDETVAWVDGEKSEIIDCSDEAVSWADDFVAGAMPIEQGHVFAVHEICLRAQSAARLL